MNDDKVRTLISHAEPLLEFLKGKITVSTDGHDIYHKTILALICIEQIREELEKKDPRSSKKFKQVKLFEK